MLPYVCNLNFGKAYGYPFLFTGLSERCLVLLSDLVYKLVAYGQMLVGSACLRCDLSGITTASLQISRWTPVDSDLSFLFIFHQ